MDGFTTVGILDGATTLNALNQNQATAINPFYGTCTAGTNSGFLGVSYMPGTGNFTTSNANGGGFGGCTVSVRGSGFGNWCVSGLNQTTCHACGGVCSESEAQRSRPRKTCQSCLYKVEDRLNELEAAVRRREEEVGARLKELDVAFEQRVGELERRWEDIVTMMRECPTKKD